MRTDSFSSSFNPILLRVDSGFSFTSKSLDQPHSSHNMISDELPVWKGGMAERFNPSSREAVVEQDYPIWEGKVTT